MVAIEFYPESTTIGGIFGVVGFFCVPVLFNCDGFEAVIIQNCLSLAKNLLEAVSR